MEQKTALPSDMKNTRMRVRGPRTKRIIEQTAYNLFVAQGYHTTSLSDIAQAAKVSPGSIHYHFTNKEEIVFSFYQTALLDFERAAQIICAESKNFEVRVRRLQASKLIALRPYRDFLKALLKFSLDPDSEISPFSNKSSLIRSRVIKVFAEAISTSDTKLPAEIAQRLPVLLWLMHMGLIFVWVHDHSAGEVKTAKVLEKSMKVLMPVLKVAKLPVVNRIFTPLFELVDEYLPIN